ncbi:MAG TPA: hemerythrin domain-containing protein [Steroidobacteraceae bacterium]|nr:hemerythrin domain-containing protein [Steroidobacteraceae bacterium]
MAMKVLAAALLAIVPLSGRGAEQGAKFPIPQSLVAEHEALQEALARAVREPGPLGAAGRAVEEVLRPHFLREEQIASPPLSLLPRLARGEASPDMADVLRMTDQLEAEMPQMLAEHRKIATALEAFRKAAVAARRDEYVEFADELMLHAQNEEQILYPAALLVGRYVKLKLKR